MAGNTENRKRSFLRLSWRRAWAISCRNAVRSSGGFSMATAASDTRTFGLHTPATVRVRALLPVRKTGTALPDSLVWHSIRMEPSNHSTSAREPRSCAIAPRAIPAPSRIRQHTPSASGAAPIDSLVERGSSSKKDGKVMARVTTEDSASGRIRRANNRSAMPRAERGRNTLRISFHPRETVTERNTYSTTNTASETPMQRAVNISASPYYGVRYGAHAAFDQAIAANHRADEHRAR